ncbi:hypothetical protein BUALT_Bualt14G0079400 [Buddleja alternifolia]|uniref:F-box domain-containing protein n=1 Tax=Buddleja alternifolia TaxID=168488 RepID=A0AAV6WMF4_9LAMI|nr:hypothetical protein BUALT_Bualt14G0079400 [Buddleja alternifolia]
MDDELQLPEVIIQHIQSFLDRKQAARTSVLSKSWYSAWSIRLILDFDERDFQIAKVFTEFVKRTMQRYHELKLKIEAFRLRIKLTNSDSVSLVNEFIKRALLQLRVRNFSLEIIGKNLEYVLPVQVFEVKSLIKLSVARCKIDQLFDGGAICSNIESLTLCNVTIRDNMIRGIMLRCPLLENLYLSECMCLVKVKLSKLHNLKKFRVTKCRDHNLKFPLIEFEERTVGSSICNRFNVTEYELSRSRTSVSITMFLDKWGDRGENNRDFPIPVVENLLIKFHPSMCLWWSNVFDDVFWSCHPKFITFCDDVNNFKTRKLLCMFLVQQASRDCFGSTRKYSYMNDLEELNVEFFEETLKQWRPVPWQALLGSSVVKENKEQFRFRLKWRAC